MKSNVVYAMLAAFQVKSALYRIVFICTQILDFSQNGYQVE